MRKKLLIVVVGGGLAFAMAVIGAVSGAGQASARPAHQAQAQVLHADPPPVIKG